MKKNILSVIRATVLCVCTVLAAQAQDNTHFIWPVKLQKDYTKTYPVGTETVDLYNRYGRMEIQPWDKNEVTVEAHISVSAKTNEYATRMLEKINVTDEKKAGSIVFRTELGERNQDWSDDNNGGYEMKIDYVVHVPAKAKLHADNSFGPLTIGDYAGELELRCRYGTLTAGKLGNALSVTVEFGKATLESVTDSKLLFRYSRVEIAQLAGRIQGEFQFCNSVDLPVDNTLKQIELKNNYTSLYLVVPKDFSADYDIVTNNARMTSKSGTVINEEKGANNNVYNPNHRYTGTLGKAGGTQINIKSNFGNVRLM
ncbi:MAG: hypothetical protein JWQ78_1752 [Sediminibacterium sp.]|nr:hypothetical protein [Sediminibacterium sp.]